MYYHFWRGLLDFACFLCFFFWFLSFKCFTYHACISLHLRIYTLTHVCVLQYIRIFLFTYLCSCVRACTLRNKQSRTYVLRSRMKDHVAKREVLPHIHVKRVMHRSHVRFPYVIWIFMLDFRNPDKQSYSCKSHRKIKWPPMSRRVSRSCETNRMLQLFSYNML